MNKNREPGGGDKVYGQSCPKKCIKVKNKDTEDTILNSRNRTRGYTTTKWDHNIDHKILPRIKYIHTRAYKLECLILLA